MDNTFLIEVNNEKARDLILQLEDLKIIRVLKQEEGKKKEGLAAKYSGIFTKEDAESFNEHVKKMRDEWDNT